MHQLDRMEEALAKIVNSIPNNPDVFSRTEVQRQVVDLFGFILQRRKIEAIKAYRMLTGYGLKESKDEIERLYFELSRTAA